METLKTTTDALNIAMETVNKTTETLNTTMETVNTAVGTVNIVMETANTVVETLNTVMETTIETVNTVVEIVNTTVETLNTSTPAAIETVSLDSLPLYQISNLLWTLCPPVIFLLGVFGNVMTLVIMRRMMSSDTDSATFPLYFASMASVDLIYLFTMVLPEWVSLTFQYRLLEQHRVVCKVFTWLYTGTGTVGCWYIVLLSLHRAVSLVWPHRVNVMCTRRVVVVLLLTVTVVLAAVYSHYLYGFDLLDPSLDTSRGCLMEDEAYIQFVVEVFVYVELVIYCLLPFVCLVLANGVLVWKLSSSVRQARHSLATGTSERTLTREKAARSVTLTVIVVSLTFLILTLPVSVFYVLSYVAKEYNEVEGQEYAKLYLFYTLSYLLSMCNSAVSFYLYCLTGRRFREEFLQVILCCKRTKEKSGEKEHSTGLTAA